MANMEAALTIKRQSGPGMHDPADKELHKREGKGPYPPPQHGARKAAKPEDDLADPGEENPDQPHDRGIVREGEYLSGRDQMDLELGEDKEAWRKGKTQNTPPRRH
jgi:hypothetical protein